MTDIYATVAVPLDQLDAARNIGGDQWGLTRALTTDANGAPPATHYGSSGKADAVLLALIVNLPGVLVNYDENVSPPDALTGFGLRFVVEEV